MKYMKYVVPLLVVAVLLTFALPVAAQGPVTVQAGGKNLRVFVRTAGTNSDPFGGFCRSYNGGVAQDAFSADPKKGNPGLGAPADFGLNPFGRCDEGGGVPSANSGDGTSPRNAVYIGGAWDPNVTVNSGETGYELPSCATLRVPAGVSRWFKADTWKNKKLQVWLDDESNTATSPSGKALFGAADAYMWGTAAGDAWQANAFFDSPNSFTGFNTLTGPSLEGYVMAIYDPDNLKANDAFPAPNGAILTVNVSGSGSPRRFANGSFAGVSLAGGGFGGIHGYGQFNPNQPSHLLWYESVFDGWTYIRIYNQMIWDGVASVCTYRATRDRP